MTRPPVLVVVAKAPVPGQVKTRLRPTLTSHQAAAVAAAALLDTLDAVRSAAASIGTRPVLALSGELADGAAPDALARAAADFVVVAQRGDTFAQRLVAAHRDAVKYAEGTVGANEGGGTIQIGMDTPQLTADQLVEVAERIGAEDGPDAVLGPAEDGGWWLLGLRRAADADAIADVAMSEPTTGELTASALRAAGLRVELIGALRDVDHPDDLAPVAEAAPTGRFAELVGVLGVRPA